MLQFRRLFIRHGYSCLSGLSRVQHIFHVVNTLELKVEIDVVRIDNPNNCYSQLRNVDNRNSKKDHYIVLDLDTVASQRAVLKQVKHVPNKRELYYFSIYTRT